MISRISKRQAGFTLIEILVVVAILGLALAIFAGARPPGRGRLAMEAAVRSVVLAMREARGEAIARGAVVSFRLPRLPAFVSVVEQAPAGGIRFAPDGSSSGGRVLMAGSGEHMAVEADWLTGIVHAAALP